MNEKKLIIYIFFFSILLFSPIILSAEDNYLINLEVEIPTEQQTVLPGEELWFTTKVLMFNNEGRKDIQLTYVILSEKRREISKKVETVAIETQASFVSGIVVPEHTNEGTYTMQVQVIDPSGEMIFTEKDFMVMNEKDLGIILKKYALEIILITLLILIVLNTFVFRKQIGILIEKFKTQQKIKKIINNKIKTNKISKKELNESKLKEKKIKKENQIF